MISSFDHFLLYSNEIEKTFQFLKNNFSLITLTPLTNYGYFQSGMFAFKNGILEILWYENKTKEEQNSLSKNEFVGFALSSDLNIKNTKRELEKLKLVSSEIIEQKIFDAKNKEVVISEILMLDHFLGDFQTFFIEYKSDFLSKKFEEQSIISPWEIDAFILETVKPVETQNGFLKLGFNEEEDTNVSDSNQIKVKIQKTESRNFISSFVIESKEGKVDILEVLNDINGFR
ncbi:hypothetical protein EHQ55_02370 [Leptospira meyeri]|nr:hypothetical protein EHQ55_02370 [Leptospira meyeri]